MPATMQIQGWAARGLRCPDHSINLCDDDGRPYPVSLIQMPNGTGKTTTLTLLRTAISGSAEGNKWTQSQVKQFQSKERKNNVGQFLVRLSLNQQLVTIIMVFNFRDGTINYKTTRGSGQVTRFDPPIEFRRFMNENFANFYIFNGELAQNLLDSKHTDAEKVVDHLFHLSTLQGLENRVQDYWDHRIKSVSATEERALTRRRNKLSTLEKRLSELESDKAKLEKDRDNIKGVLREKQETYDLELKKNSDLERSIKDAETNFAQKRGLVREQAQVVLNTMADPHALSVKFANAIYLLKTSLDRVKLPESAAREFFEELAEEDTCICGRSIDDEIRSVIRTRANSYLGTDDVALLNSIKSAISDAVGRSREEPEKVLQTKMAELARTVRDERFAHNKFDELKLYADQSDPAIKETSEIINEAEENLELIDGLLARFRSKDTSQPDEHTYGIRVIKKRIDDAEIKLAEITQTLELRAKRDILKRIVKEAYATARSTMSRDICNDANVRIRTLMPYNDITIDHIDKCLVLRGQAGGSSGEQLSIAYAFLSTLFNRSGYQLPFVVDSPANPIDLAIRPKIGRLVPKLSGQFVAFTISSERQNFVPHVKRATSGQVQFITMFRKGPGEIEQQARATSTFTESADGMMVGGEEFFNDFHLEQENG